MYTVILYRDSAELNIEKYHFIFTSTQEEQELLLYRWDDKPKGEQIIEELNRRTERRNPWRLILFDGKFPIRNFADSESISDGKAICPEVLKVLKYYCESDDTFPEKPKGCFPEHVWYITWHSKQKVPTASGSEYQVVDELREMGRTFRMFWTEIDVSCNMYRNFDVFKLNCILLILAVNPFPYDVLDCGYLYQLQLYIDRDKMAEYVVKQEKRLKKIEWDLEITGKELEKVSREGVGYEEVVFEKCKLDEQRNRMANNRDIKEISHGDLNDIQNLIESMENNQKVVRAWWSFPKSILREENEKINNELEKKISPDIFLNCAGEERLEQEKWDVLQKLSGLDKIPLQKQNFREALYRQEEILYKSARSKLGRKMKRRILWLYSFVEWLMLLAFWVGAQLMPESNNESFLKKMINVVSQALSVTFANVLFFILSLIVILILTFVVSWIITGVNDRDKVRKYNNLIKKGLEEKQEQALTYFEHTMDLIKKYRYIYRLEERQLSQKKTWEEKKECLNRHRLVWKNSEFVCQDLRCLLGDEIKDEFDSDEPQIDFEKEPQEIEYYWIPFRKSACMQNLNGNGKGIKVFFNFISKFYITKTFRSEV